MSKKYVSPKGVAQYPRLTSEDPKFGGYKTSLVVSAKDAEGIIEMMKEVFVDEFGPKKLASANLPYVENEDGTVTLKFKSKNMPKFFDAKGQPVKNPADLKIGGGSVIKVSGNMKATTSGSKNFISAYISAVQIIDLVEYGGASFEEEEGSFTVSEGAEEDEAVNF